MQAWIWSAGYAGFAVLCATTAWLSSRCRGETKLQAAADAPAPTPGSRALWCLLSACASTLLLGVTNFLTQDVAAIPFLWIAPLAVYLLSFIVCFEAQKFYSRLVYFPLAAAALAGFAWRLRPAAWQGHTAVTIALTLTGLFACCMVCHGELAARKPHPRYLTGFYVMVSLGGAAGGLFVGLFAPNFFEGYYEFPIALALCAVLITVLTPAPRQWMKTWRPALGVPLGIFIAYLALATLQARGSYRVVQRNFYGQLRVGDVGNPSEDHASRLMLHGLISHGRQMLNPKYRRQPVTYFCPASGIGQAMSALPQRAPRRIGILGLGCGTLAAYGRAGDTIRLYEINPQVVSLAKSEFTYLSDSPAKIEVVLGDARLELEREPNAQFDLLVMDAFSGDSIPVHLVTREAFATYFRHLRPGGIVAANLTNRYVDLRPVMAAVAEHFGKTAAQYLFQPDEVDLFCFRSTWVLIADRPVLMSGPAAPAADQVLRPEPGFRLWTDDFSNLLGVLR